MWLHVEQLQCMCVHCSTYMHGYVVIQHEVLLQLVRAQLHTCFQYTAVLKKCPEHIHKGYCVFFVFFLQGKEHARFFLCVLCLSFI